MDISLAARLAETPLDEFIALNPAYHRPVVAGDSRSPLVLPADKVDTFRRNLERHEAEDRPLSSWQTYTLKKGERLDAVAARFGLSTVRLKQLNGITPRVKVGPGFNLLVPGKGAQEAAAAVAGKLPQPQPDAPAAKGKKGAKPAKGKTAQKGLGAKPKAAAKPRPAAKGKKR
jgi:membrane-bound lytic murein transglycosylase D